MTFKEIQDLIKLVNRLDIAEFKMKEKDFGITIRSNDYVTKKNQSRDSPCIVRIHFQVSYHRLQIVLCSAEMEMY